MGNISPSQKPLKTKVMLRFYKAVEVQLPIWKDGVRTADTETRVSALFVQDSTKRGISYVQWGSAIISRDMTLADVNAEFSIDEDLTKEFKMIKKENSEFMRVVPC
jgi:hypothetical protein